MKKPRRSPPLPIRQWRVLENLAAGVPSNRQHVPSDVGVQLEMLGLVVAYTCHEPYAYYAYRLTDTGRAILDSDAGDMRKVIACGVLIAGGSS
jgi:hypothetical protein